MPDKKKGLVVQLVRMPACHAGGRGFESRPDRQVWKPDSKESGFFRRKRGREVYPRSSGELPSRPLAFASFGERGKGMARSIASGFFLCKKTGREACLRDRGELPSRPPNFLITEAIAIAQWVDSVVDLLKCITSISLQINLRVSSM